MYETLINDLINENPEIKLAYTYLQTAYRGDDYYLYTLLEFINDYNLRYNHMLNLLKYIREGNFLQEEDLRLVITYYQETGTDNINEEIYDFYRIIDFMKRNKILNKEYKELLINIKDVLINDNFNLYNNFIESFNLYNGDTNYIEQHLRDLYSIDTPVYK